MREKAQEYFENLRQCVKLAGSRSHKLFMKGHTVVLADPTARSRLRFSVVHESSWTVEDGGGASHSSLKFTMLPDEFLQNSAIPAPSTSQKFAQEAASDYEYSRERRLRPGEGASLAQGAATATATDA